ncbi:MAG: Wzz/FepE/Etk N-terminal domain-containing protein [Candidatus Rokuibacteriota bacterium]
MATPSATHPEPRRGLALNALLEVVRRRRLLALLPALFVLTAAASFAFFLPGLWTARTVVLIDRQQIPEAFVKPTVTADFEGQLLTVSQEILSRPRLAKIIQELDLYPRLRASHSADDLVDRMRRDIHLDYQSEQERRARREERTVAFSVAYSATDPHTAMLVANKLADLYVEENDRYRERQAIGTSEFLETQLGEVRARLQAQEKRIAEYKERYMGELPEQREANFRTLERLQQQLLLAHEGNRRATERRQLITQALAEIDQTSGLTRPASGPNVSPAESTAARLALLRQELVEMQTRYGERYPDVKHVKAQIQALEARVAEQQVIAAAAAKAPPARQEISHLRPAPENPYVVSLMQQLGQANVEAKTTSEEIAAFNRQIGEYQRRIENTPRREQELALTTRDYETTRDLFRSLLAKRGEADIAADLEQRQKGERFRILEPAALPERPVGPNRLRLLLIGLVLAVGASVLAVVLAEHVDTSYRRVEEVRASLPVPVLSAIPTIITDHDRARLARQRTLTTAAVTVALLAVVGSTFAVAHRNEALVAMLTPPDSMAVRR